MLALLKADHIIPCIRRMWHVLSSSRHKETLKKSFIILCVGNLHEQTKVSFLKRPAATNETGSDVSALSPFTNNDTLRFHIRRAGYQLLMWKTANCCFLLLPVPAYMKYRNRTVMVAGFFPRPWSLGPYQIVVSIYS